jgi:hypothetical protein
MNKKIKILNNALLRMGHIEESFVLNKISAQQIKKAGLVSDIFAIKNFKNLSKDKK